jgi:hypothetical protein
LFTINLFQAIIIFVDKKAIKDYFKDLSVEVIGGLMVALVLAIVGALQVFAPRVLQFIWQGITTVGGFLLSPISLPVWLVGALVLLSLFTLRLFILRFIPKKTGIIENGPRLSEYSEDYIFGLIWKWKAIQENFPDNSLGCFCPICSTRLVQKEWGSPNTSQFTDFHCSYCEKHIKRLEGYMDEIISRVDFEVERKINTGEWKDVVRRSKAGRLVPEEEMGE